MEFKNIEWRDIKGFEGLYKISSGGVVMNTRTGLTLFGGLDSSKYPMVILSKGCMNHTKKIHKLVAEAFIKNTDNKPLVHHKDTNKENNHVENLEWVTHSENLLYRFEHTNGPIKSKVLEMKKAGYNHTQIARSLGIGRSRVTRFVNGH